MSRVIILVSAHTEWRVIRALYPLARLQQTPFGESFSLPGAEGVRYLQGGWGKIAAAASAQYAIDTFSPDLLINLGTCGGFAGYTQAGEVILAEKTLVYDIVEQMGDAQEALEHYATLLDLSWLSEPYPQPVRRALLLSADRDILPAEAESLAATFGAPAADWESGAIAWVAAKNKTRLLILRVVSDIVSAKGGEAYEGSADLFKERTQAFLPPLAARLMDWIKAAGM